MTGSIKDYTPNFEFIIPEFNITGWHDYLEENFRSIDALFYNLFGINNFKGQWKNSTIYNINDVVFIGEDTNYSGRLIKVLVQHTTASTGNFTEFFTSNPSYYELFADASAAQIFAQEAKDWAVKMDGPVENNLYSSKYYADIVNSLSTEITTLYNIRNDIQNVNLISTEIVDVSNIKNSVQSVANNSTNINTVANNILNINNVSDNINAINTANNNITNINSVANNITNIDTVANNTTNINTTATNIANVNTNATNINAINTNASNISVIQNAYSNAQSALNSKNLAQEWATSTTLVDNTDYSAKYYANLAKSEAESIDPNNLIHKTGNETVTGIKTFTRQINVNGTDVSALILNIPGVSWASLNIQANGRGPYLTTGNFQQYLPLFLGSSNEVNSAVTTRAIGTNYVKLGNNLIIQWGIITVDLSNHYSASITFPTPFSNTNYSICLSQYYTANTENWNTAAVLMFGNKTTTGVTTQSQHTDRLQWIAFGY